jgi:hypothetical protein
MATFRQLERAVEAEKQRQIKSWLRELIAAEKRADRDYKAEYRMRMMLRSLGHHGATRRKS